MGCDCEQCFGYCMIDKDEAMRARLTKFETSVLDDFPLEHLKGEATA